MSSRVGRSAAPPSFVGTALMVFACSTCPGPRPERWDTGTSGARGSERRRGRRPGQGRGSCRRTGAGPRSGHAARCVAARLRGRRYDRAVGDLLEMTVDSIRVHMPTGQHVVILKEKTAERYLPIWIGINEANAIALKITGMTPERPITHDLLANI